jgi:hypothetical protein
VVLKRRRTAAPAPLAPEPGQSNEPLQDFDYLPEHILRVPDPRPPGPAHSQRMAGEQSQEDRACPGADGLPVTDAYALLLLAAAS